MIGKVANSELFSVLLAFSISSNKAVSSLTKQALERAVEVLNDLRGAMAVTRLALALNERSLLSIT